MTLWYDYTTTLRNTGRSGIANVEWSIGEALRQSAPGVRGFALDHRGDLVEIDPQVDLAATVYADSAATATMATVVAPTWRQTAISAIELVLGDRSAPVIRLLARMAKLPRRLVGLARRPQARLSATSRNRLAAIVRPDDIVVSMGAVWDGSVAEELLGLRAQTGCRVVTMVYDLVPLTHTHLAFHKDPDLFTRYYRALISASDLITCISEQSRSDLHEFADELGLALPVTAVLRLGEATSVRDAAGRAGDRDFFLCVGTIERRKNLELVYDALRIIEAEGAPLPHVVVAGAAGWGVGDFLHELSLRSTGAARAMVLLGSVDEAELDGLYRRATALLFPSLYEGWGLPVREAAVRGCPVAVGDSPAVREAAAGYDGATVLSPDDPSPWAEYMRRPPPPATAVAARTWSACARDLLELATQADRLSQESDRRHR